MGCYNMGTEMVFWRSEQHFGALDALQSCHDNSTSIQNSTQRSLADIVQGGTSGIGAAVAHHLATRGAQIILLTHHAQSDPFLADYVEDLRSSTNNELIYAEQVDLSSLQSIRLFATKWVDNAPPGDLI